MVTIDEFSRLVSNVYAASISISPANWAQALSDISRVLDGVGSGIITSSGGDRAPLCATTPVEAVATYRAYYREIDYVLADVEAGPVGLVRGGAEIIRPGAGTEFDADWMRPYGLQDGIFVRLAAGTETTSFFVAAPKRSEPFDTGERVKLVNALIPHLQQALCTQSRLAELGRAATEITEALDVIRHGIVIVGAEHAVVRLNSAAEQIFKSGDGLRIRSGIIEAARTSTNQQLQGSIAGALVHRRCGARRGSSFTCSRPSGKRPYVIHILPRTATSADPSAATALVIIIDPEREIEPPKMLVRRLFGLTNAEVDVALRVMRGDGLKPIAADLGLSRATVNTHLQHIFDKTDTHRQAELVRLLLAIIP
jgi:DNA-binding CsgD family transcriptional regulator